MADSLDIDEMIARFRERAEAVKKRDLPPVGGDERKRFLEQKRIDYLDYAIIGDAVGRVNDGIVTLTIDLRPPADS
jgi:hypothetical protein